MVELRIELLGPPVVTVDGRPMQVDTRKAIAILAYLAAVERPASRDTLAFLLWPDYPTDRARAALRRTISALRTGLDGHWVRADRNQVELPVVPALWVDVTEFEARAHSEDPEALREAALLYRGDFLAGFGIRDSPEFDHWQLGQAEHLRARAAAVFGRLSDVEAERGDYPAAISAGRRWLDLDPLHEPAHRQLMRLYALGGDRSAALRQYRSAARLLEQELGVAPLSETTDLSHAISASSLAPVTPRPAPPIAPRPVLSTPRRLPFVGRETELAALLSAYAGTGTRAVAVVGEPGIGKTRLADEFILRVGIDAVRAAAHRGEETIPFGLTIEMLRVGLARPEAQTRLGAASSPALAEAARLVPDLLPEGGPLPSEEGPGGLARLLAGAAEVISALIADAVLILDDLQWADSESVGVIDRVLQRPEGPFVVVIYRETDLPPAHRIPAMVRDHTRAGRLEVLPLGRLSRADLAVLVKEEAPQHQDRTDDLVRLSEGIPFFAVEYLAAIRSGRDQTDELPGGVRDLLTERVAGLSALAAQVLGAAAVLGRSFDLTTVRAVSGRSEPEAVAGIEELLEHGLLEETDQADVLDFQHDGLRQLVYESTNALRRRRLHGRAADRLLAEAGSPDENIAARAALHLEAAGRMREASVQHAVAGDQARALFANETALHHYDAALSLGHPDPDILQEAIGDLLALAGRYGDGLDHLQVAAAAATGEQLARLEHKMAVIHARAGEWERAEAHLQAASIGFQFAVERALVWADWAWVAHRRGNREQAAELAKGALAEAAATGNPHALAQAHNVAGILLRASDPEAAREHFIEALDLADDRTTRAAALNNLALAAWSSGDPEAGLAWGRQAREVYATVGDRHREAAVNSNLADLLHAAGRDEEAQQHQRAAAALFSEVGLEPGALEPEIWKLTEW